MKAGQLIAQGTLFLRGAVYRALTSAGETQYTLPLLERRGAGVQHVTALWTGAVASSFMAAHGDALKPGKALEITFERIFAHNNEIHGVIYSATLAPDRWQSSRQAAAGEAAIQPQPAPQEAHA